MSVERDTSHGATAQAASTGQLARYRDTAKSSMADLKAVSHTIRQNGHDALWLEIDYHWAGQVYQLLLDPDARPEKLATQQRLLTTARAQLLIDRG
ncbi:hypothetical protein [Streptomyces sp. NPDC102437]|uniref:hypothetical protein n=1 Tax=Streptomyces sp. NPDC102437 TaxID=3366175 RepID=UPI0037FD49E8